MTILITAPTNIDKTIRGVVFVDGEARVESIEPEEQSRFMGDGFAFTEVAV